MSMREIAISVLIATRNRAEVLNDTLQSLKAQVVPNSVIWEAIIIDNGSSDQTSDTINCNKRELRLIHLEESKPGKSAALNKALTVARGDIFVFTDDDVKPSLTWLSELYRAAQVWRDYNIFCGPIIPLYPPDPPDWFDPAHFYTSPAFARFEVSQPEGVLPKHILPYGPNFAIRSRIMVGVTFCEQYGPGPNEPTGEDTELITRLVNRGERCIYLPSAGVGHKIDRRTMNLQWLNQRAFRHGRGLVRLSANKTWRQLQIEWLYLLFIKIVVKIKYRLRSPKGESARVKYEWIINFLSGMQHECRFTVGRAKGSEIKK
jgi:glycosyltransferase involved in cell wall biosynthesis